MDSAKNSVVLVVDDNPTNLAVLSEALADSGFEVGVATSGEGAIQQIAYNLPDLVLLDVMMPGIDGFETCRRLKENPLAKDIPIIFMTALSDPVDKVKGLALGAVDYITKPFQQEEVLARVQMHLRVRSLTQTLATQNAQLKQLTESLEHRVEERSQELHKAQLQLIQTEKLSSLGQLVAGVAHEINNPVGCISSNLTPAADYVADITQILRLYQQHYPNPVPAIEEAIEAVDLEFVLEDLPKLLHSMTSSAVRIREISVSLRNFSRTDASSLTVADIQEGLDSTLLILQHRLKACGDRPEIHIVRKYAAIPEVECYPGQLNQVFMNLFSNAIDALEEALESGEWNREQREVRNLPEIDHCPAPTIRVHTEQLENDRIRITIADNGPGIPEAALNRLFDPFFTTKSVGKGTGLGMSISYQIITEKHQGDIQCLSMLGEGTEFMIEIPIRQSNPADLSDAA